MEETKVEETKKDKKWLKILIPIIIILIILGILFGIKTYFSSPKTVYSKMINNLYKDTSNTIKDLDDKDKTLNIENIPNISFSSTIETDMDISELIDLDTEDINGLELNLDYGIDLKNKEMSGAANIKGDTETISGDFYVEDTVAYLKLSFYEEILKITDLDIDYTSLEEELSETDFNTEDIDYVLEAYKNALINALDPDTMEKSSDEIKVLDNELKVTKYTYTINEKTYQKMNKSILTDLLKDDKFIKSVATLTGETEEDIKEELKEAKESSDDIELDGKIKINLYTKGLLNEFSGIDLNYDKTDIIKYYTDGKNYDITIGEGDAQARLTIEKDGDEYLVKGTVLGEKVLTAKVKEFSSEKISLEYEISYDEFELSGDIYWTRKLESKKVSGEYKINIEYDSKYLNLNGDYEIKDVESLEKIDTTKSTIITDVDTSKLKESFEKAVNNDSKLKNIYETIKKSYEDNLIEDKLNYLGMYTLYSNDEAKNILTSTDSKVLYVGKTYYYDDDKAKDFLDNLVDIQDELDFYMYYYNSLYVDSSFDELVKDIELTCKEDSDTCTKYPVVYLIKDGKVVKTLQSNSTKEEIKTALAEIDIK